MSKLNPFPVLPKIALYALGSRISQARRVREMTQTDLARAADLGLSTVVDLEAGKPGVSLGSLAKVMETLGLLGQLDQVFDPHKDPQFTEQAIRKLPKRA
ncbi:MAG: helix-turn-helix domain-containing protein [Polaromonas sp.]|uniref:helix-turn-helix domain-containing protein n=1 Tax=Polaromonas sp. TaxID=1869339 RepID=UPI00248921BD|nr:helix-turn-helix domain-containing protein [Polaromonas sp.]MDI1271300.1 helix-turn-helix domain-containing protein [Polaromonas sp.]